MVQLGSANVSRASGGTLMRVVVVDPSRTVVKFITRLLEARAHEVRAFVDGHEALAHPRSDAMLDIDHFKGVNDVYGHDIGDKAICGVAAAAATEDAIFGRLGGEEFAMLLEGRAVSETVAIAERLRRKMAEMQFETGKGVMTLT